MGRGSRTSQTKVKKTRQEYTRSSQATSPSGSNRDSKTADACLFSFRASVIIPKAEAVGLEKSSTVVIAPHHTRKNELVLFIGNKSFGPYKGSHLKRIIFCIQKGYVYDGTVESLGKTSTGVKIKYLVEGRGR